MENTNVNVNAEGQINLLELLPEDEQKKIAPVNAAAVSTSKKASKPVVKPTEEPEPDEYECDRIVYYAGHRLDVPSRKMKLKDVRAWLEEQFPELTEENTELRYDKETAHIVPVLKGHKKGATLSVLVDTEPEKVVPVYHKLGDDGRVYEIRTTQSGAFAAPLCGKFEAQNINHFDLSVPSIPMSVLQEILARFMAEPEREHLAYVVWSNERFYTVYWPEQQATRVSVEGEGFMETEDEFIVAHIHSHGRLNAFFSGTDNADEIRTGLYGVVGQCHKNKPMLKFRYSVGGKFVMIHPQTVFAGDISEVVRV